MKPERVLTLDISTKTGWCLTISTDNIQLEAYGQIPKIECPDSESYPSSYVIWAALCYEEIEKLFELHTPDVLVIEETAANSKSSHSQKILEWIHYLVARLIKETGIKSVYLQTGEWRKEAESRMNAEEKEHNKKWKKYKSQSKTNVVYDIETGKRIGKINKKHVAIRRANEVFGKYFKQPLRKKDEDLADSLVIALAYHLKRKRGLYE